MIYPDYRHFLFAFALCLAPLASGAKQATEFSLLLPQKDSGRVVTLDYFHGSPALIAFWRSDCPPCIAERPILNDIAKAHPDLKVVLVSLDGNAYRQRHFPATVYANMTVLLTIDKAEETLKAVGDAHVALPYSMFLKADGSTCDTHYGLLGTDKADEWMKRC